ncbi:MAG TPA: hypothetical protein VE990_07875 [Acidimicrobiales bacterium]|nr:hypothetical protein [Acidimicrobiales bacterium]
MRQELSIETGFIIRDFAPLFAVLTAALACALGAWFGGILGGGSVCLISMIAVPLAVRRWGVKR